MPGESDMIKYLVVCKSFADVEPAKKLAEEQGGKITDTRTIYPGFDVLMPKDTLSTFASSKHIESAEIDGEVKTQ